MTTLHRQATLLWTAAVAWGQAAEACTSYDLHRLYKKNQAELLVRRAELLQKVANGDNSPEYIWRAKIAPGPPEANPGGPSHNVPTALTPQ